MSRPLRIQYPNAWYHVMNRGRRAEAIFGGKKDNFTFIDLLKEAVDLWNLRVSAYCLLSNHYHILVQTPDAICPDACGTSTAFILSVSTGPIT